MYQSMWNLGFHRETAGIRLSTTLPRMCVTELSGYSQFHCQELLQGQYQVQERLRNYSAAKAALLKALKIAQSRQPAGPEKNIATFYNKLAITSINLDQMQEAVQIWISRTGKCHRMDPNANPDDLFTAQHNLTLSLDQRWCLRSGPKKSWIGRRN